MGVSEPSTLTPPPSREVRNVAFGFWVLGSEFGVQDSGFRVQGSGFKFLVGPLWEGYHEPKCTSLGHRNPNSKVGPFIQNIRPSTQNKRPFTQVQEQLQGMGLELDRMSAESKRTSLEHHAALDSSEMELLDTHARLAETQVPLSCGRAPPYRATVGS